MLGGGLPRAGPTAQAATFLRGGPGGDFQKS